MLVAVGGMLFRIASGNNLRVSRNFWPPTQLHDQVRSKTEPFCVTRRQLGVCAGQLAQVLIHLSMPHQTNDVCDEGHVTLLRQGDT